jgi:hypothetical protein
MTWVNHKIVGFAIPFMFTRNYLFSFLSAIFSILPDLVEGNRMVLKHRGISHNPFLWLAVCLSAYAFALFGPVESMLHLDPATPLPFVPRLLLSWAVLAAASGVFLHLACDSLTMTGVPLYGNRRFALKLFRTGSPVEYIISMALIVVLVYILMPSDVFAQNKEIIDNIDPLKQFGEQQYMSFWSQMFNTIFSGIWVRIIASAFLFLAFWFGVYRQQASTGVALFVMAVMCAYITPVVHVLFKWTK